MPHEHRHAYTPPGTFVDGFEPLFEDAEYRGLFTHPDHDVVLRARSLQLDDPETIVREAALFERALEGFTRFTKIPAVEHQYIIADTPIPEQQWTSPTLVVIARKLNDYTSFDQAIATGHRLREFDAAAARIVSYIRHLIDKGGPVHLDTVFLDQMVFDEKTHQVTLIDVAFEDSAYESRPIVGAGPDESWIEKTALSRVVRMLESEIEKLESSMSDDMHSRAAIELHELRQYMDELGIVGDELEDELWDE